jgi:hypothetical protein
MTLPLPPSFVIAENQFIFMIELNMLAAIDHDNMIFVITSPDSSIHEDPVIISFMHDISSFETSGIGRIFHHQSFGSLFVQMITKTSGTSVPQISHWP